MKTTDLILAGAALLILPKIISPASNSQNSTPSVTAPAIVAHPPAILSIPASTSMAAPTFITSPQSTPTILTQENLTSVVGKITHTRIAGYNIGALVSSTRTTKNKNPAREAKARLLEHQLTLLQRRTKSVRLSGNSALAYKPQEDSLIAQIKQLRYG